MTLLEVRGLTKRFGGNLAVDDVSFDLRAGELLALIGPNGAGKSTTFNMVGGQLPATSGSVRLEGRPLLGLPTHRIAALGVGRTFQIAATFASLSVQENVQLAIMSQRREIFSWWRHGTSRYRDEALDILEQVGMREYAALPCRELAYGDIKRVELALALAGNPKLLLMDEPTAGMASAERQALVGLVKQLVRDRQLAVLFTEHSMDVVFAYADRVIVLARGKLIAQGSVQDIRDDPHVQAVYFGSGRSFESAHGGQSPT